MLATSKQKKEKLSASAKEMRLFSDDEELNVGEQFEIALNEVKEIEAGRIKTKTWRQIFAELGEAKAWVIGKIYLLNLYFKKSDNDVVDESEIKAIIDKYI